jgi:hypothetical protein
MKEQHGQSIPEIDLSENREFQCVLDAKVRADAIADAERVRRMLGRWIAQQIMRKGVRS